MGRAKALKEQRKIERIQKAEQKKQKLRTGIVVVLAVIFGTLLAFGAFKLTKFVKNKYFNKTENVSQEAEKVSDRKYDQAPSMAIDINKTYIAKFETSQGNFDIELFAKDAPKTVNNFVFLAKDGFYDGLTFHRVIKDFMIQGGDPKGDGTGGPGYKFDDEINEHKLVKGVLAMANSGTDSSGHGTNGSQFFIVTAEKAEWLDGKHTAFGQILNGLENVMKIEQVETGENDKPKEAVTINKVTIEER